MTDVSRLASSRQLGVGDDERLEPEGPGWATVVGHDRGDRPHVALGVDGREVAQRRAAQLSGGPPSSAVSDRASSIAVIASCWFAVDSLEILVGLCLTVGASAHGPR